MGIPGESPAVPPCGPSLRGPRSRIPAAMAIEARVQPASPQKAAKAVGPSSNIRWRQCWLLSASRALCQANRVLFGALLPFIANDLQMTAAQKGSALSAFAGGYALTQVAGGVATDRFGAYPLIVFATAVMSLGTLLAPAALNKDLSTFCLLSFATGLADGTTFPAAAAALARWVPMHERGSAVAIVDSGGSLGTMFVFSIAPLLAANYGWRFAFRFVGLLSCAVTLAYACFAASGPDRWGGLSEDERSYLTNHGLEATLRASRPQKATKGPFSGGFLVPQWLVHLVGRQLSRRWSGLAMRRRQTPRAEPSDAAAGAATTAATVDSSDTASAAAAVDAADVKSEGKRKRDFAAKKEAAKKEAALAANKPVPTGSAFHTFPFRLFARAPVCALILAHCAFNFGRYFVYNLLVSYYVDVVGLGAVEAGRRLLLGQVFDTLGKFACAPFVDALLKRNPTNKTFIRRKVSAAAFCGFAASMVLIAAGGGRDGVATMALVLAKVASSAHVSGFKSNYLDLTSKHAGTLAGVGNTAATLASMLAPLVGGRLIMAEDGWRKMFCLIAIVNLAAAAFWAKCASAESLDAKVKTNGAS
ncbi:major facilitator superfamily domain-containing protein, partial [Pelagophyceae sp. CCMP2097]